jgi:hypothetical protein
MGYEISLSPRAMKEIEQAIDYYSENQNTVWKFYEELDICYEILKNNPFLEVRYRAMRALPMRVFPYIVLFTIEINEVFIYSIFNTYQSTSKYPK